MRRPLRSLICRAVATLALVLAAHAMGQPASAGPSQPEGAPVARPKADQPEPMSARAAAAAARAARALAEEDNVESVATPAETTDTAADGTSAMVPKQTTQARSQPLTPGIKRRTSAETTCVAGC